MSLVILAAVKSTFALGGIVLVVGLLCLVCLFALPLLVVYFFSVASRNKYHCPNCHEEITTEYMQAGYCSKCGTPLEEN